MSSTPAKPGRRCARAFPGEDPETVKPPEEVADFIVERIASHAPTGERVRVEA
jgi:hypothetical protein